MQLLQNAWVLPGAGLTVGVVIGYVARRTHFCTMSALERHWYAGDSRGLRAWALAAAVALLLTQALQAAGLIDISSTFYLTEPLPVAGALFGGFMFGVGMALVGTCAFGAIVRLGGGNLRALVVLTGIALAAIAAQRGITGHLRVAAIEPLSVDLSAWGGQSAGALVSTLVGRDVSMLVTILLTAPLFYWIFKDRGFLRDREKLASGLIIGTGIAAGWVVTSTLARTLFVPTQLEAGSFVAPLGDTMMQLVTVTGALPDYGVGLAVGVFLGATARAWTSNDMRWEACDDARELGRHLLGAFLMGTGGIFALGCTIGQGVTAVSAMAMSAPLAMIGIAFGARVGLAYLVEGSPVAFLRRAPIGGGQPAE